MLYTVARSSGLFPERASQARLASPWNRLRNRGPFKGRPSPIAGVGSANVHMMQKISRIHPAVCELAEFFLEVINLPGRTDKSIALEEFKKKHSQTVAIVGSDFQRQFDQALETLKQKKEQDELKSNQRLNRERKRLLRLNLKDVAKVVRQALETILAPQFRN